MENYNLVPKATSQIPETSQNPVSQSSENEAAV
jgi:hypothetical protein